MITINFLFHIQQTFAAVILETSEVLIRNILHIWKKKSWQSNLAMYPALFQTKDCMPAPHGFGPRPDWVKMQIEDFVQLRQVSGP